MARNGNRPRSTLRAVAFNSGWQLATFSARAASGLLVTVLLAHAEGPTALGAFQFALNFTLLFGFLIGFGLPNLLAREVARRPQDGPRWTESGLFLALVVGGGMAIVLAVGARHFGARSDVADAVALGGFALAFDTASRVEFALFWSWERMGLEAFATSVQEGAFLAGAVAAIAGGFGAPGVMLAYLVSRALGMLVGWVIAFRRTGRPLLPRPHRMFLAGMLRRAVPFALDDALSLTYIRVDSVMLGFIQGPLAVGFYQAGTNLVLYLNILARMLNNALYPRMSRAWPGDRATLARLRDASLRILSAVGVPLMVGSFLLAPRIFDFLYGPKFQPAVLCYRVLVLVIPIRMLGHTLGTALTAADGQTQRTIAVAAAAFANVALNLYAIPRWSYLGGAETTLVTESGLFIAYGLLLHRAVGASPILAAVSRPAFASIPMGAVALLLPNLPLLPLIALAGAAYVVALFALTIPQIPPESRGGSPRAAVSALVKAAL